MTLMAKAGRLNAEIETRNGMRGLAQWATCLMLAAQKGENPFHLFQQRHPRSIFLEQLNAHQKAVVTPLAASGSALAVPNPFAEAFIASLAPKTIIGQLQSAMRPAPFNAVVPRVTQGAAVGWVAEGKPAQVSALSMDTASLGIAKISGVTIFSRELLKLSDPAAEAFIGGELTGATAKVLDQSFVDPTIAATSAHPASISYGARSVTATGTGATNAIADLKSLLEALTDSDLAAPFFIMSKKCAVRLAALHFTNGDPAFPDLGVNGGVCLGVPVITSENMPDDESSPEQFQIVALDASKILFADGGIELDVSEQALVQMDSAPDDPTTASSVMISLFQHNFAGLRVTRVLNWVKRRANVV